MRLVLCLILLLSAPLSMADEEMLGVMNFLQRFAHKTQLSLDAGNLQLAAFYIHELEEGIEELEEISMYDGHPVGELAESILVPSMEELEVAIESGSRQQALIHMDGLIASCNQCHEKAGHSEVVIKTNHTNPFLQDFSPRE